MSRASAREWAAHLRKLAEPVLADVDEEALLSRERVRPWSALGPLILHLRGATGDGPADVDPDVALWWGLVDGGTGGVEGHVDLEDAGPLWERGEETALEVWTERELCGLTALWRHWLRSGRKEIRQRCVAAAKWHIENTQPDNATNRPWGVAVFLGLGSAEGRHYAETLVSNCCVNEGRPDVLSAYVLLDAAAALEAEG